MAARRFLDTLELIRHLFADFRKQLCFQQDRFIVRAQNTVFQILKFLRNVALRVGKRLLTDIIGRELYLYMYWRISI